MCNNRTCFCQNIQCSVCQCLSVDLAACRCNDQLHKVCNFLPFEYFCCSSKVFQTTVCTGSDKYLVNLCSFQFTNISDLINLGRTCHNRNKILCLICHSFHIDSIFISNKAFLVVVEFNLTIFCRLLIRCEKSTFCSCLDCHIRHCHTACN